MVKSFNQSFDLYRPVDKRSFSSEQSYLVEVLDHCKLGQPSKGWSVSTDGTVQAQTATLFFNVSISTASPSLVPLFKAGDVLVAHGGDVAGDRRVVQSVTEQWLRGSLHHYEVVLV